MMLKEQEELQDLFELALGQECNGFASGCMSVSVYDTAWVSCVTKHGADCFPSSFEYVVESQQRDGLWHSGPLCSDVLNSLGGLFALVKHRRRSGSDSHQARIELATRALADALQAWQIEENGGVAFEVLMPTMLTLLESEGILLDFPAKSALCALRDEKLSLIPLEKLYEKPNSVLHSIEAFFADKDFDFDVMRNHKVCKSMLGSPSATAAYLMRCSTWDDDAEDYLRQVIEQGAGCSSGGVPSAYPSNIFELTWLSTTALSSARDFQDLPADLRKRIEMFVESTGASKGECVGFAQGFEPDLDDTAKMSILLNIMSRPGLSRQMMAQFESETHFRCYSRERNPSFSANCNAIHALVRDLAHQSEAENEVMGAIGKATRFLCERWWDCEGFPIDKWNLSPYYSAMLMTSSFQELLIAFDQNHSLILESEVECIRSIQLVLIQCLTRILQRQEADGSWGEIDKCEETAYAVLAVSACHSIAWFSAFENELRDAVLRGRQYLNNKSPYSTQGKLWVEKVTYGSDILARSYRLAALREDINDQAQYGVRWSAMVVVTASHQPRPMDKVLAQLPALQSCPQWVLRASRIEAELFLARLRGLRDSIFLREGFSEDKYFEWIPNIWTVANNNASRGYCSCRFLFNMMTVSFINFQVDEFMESVVAQLSPDSLCVVKASIAALLDNTDAKGLRVNDNPSLTNNNNHDAKSNGYKNGYHSRLQQVVEVLSRYISYVMSHPDVEAAGANDKRLLGTELHKFLTAHLTQIDDNRALQEQEQKEKAAGRWRPRGEPTLLKEPRQSFQGWVRGTGSEHTSCPYSFVLACCWSSSRNQDFFQTTRQKYIAHDVCHRLATMCRVYNDYGSLRRDVDESNLNCANFPELWAGVSAAEEDVVAAVKKGIFEVADYERAMLEASFRQLEPLSSRSVTGMLRVFIMVTDMFGQIYVVRDLASRRQEPYRAERHGARKKELLATERVDKRHKIGVDESSSSPSSSPRCSKRLRVGR